MNKTIKKILTSKTTSLIAVAMLAASGITRLIDDRHIDNLQTQVDRFQESEDIGSLHDAEESLKEYGQLSKTKKDADIVSNKFVSGEDTDVLEEKELLLSNAETDLDDIRNPLAIGHYYTAEVADNYKATRMELTKDAEEVRAAIKVDVARREQQHIYYGGTYPFTPDNLPKPTLMCPPLGF